MTATAIGQYVQVDGTNTFYMEAGHGEPVVLIHGAAPGACSKIHWKRNIDDLANAGFRVYAFDQPGFGHTANPEDHSLEYRVAHAGSFIEALGLDRFHVVGSSV